MDKPGYYRIAGENQEPLEGNLAGFDLTVLHRMQIGDIAAFTTDTAVSGMTVNG
jgi:hypothetical protein